jgi:hypothetical protein
LLPVCFKAISDNEILCLSPAGCGNPPSGAVHFTFRGSVLVGPRHCLPRYCGDVSSVAFQALRPILLDSCQGYSADYMWHFGARYRNICQHSQHRPLVSIGRAS